LKDSIDHVFTLITNAKEKDFNFYVRGGRVSERGIKVIKIKFGLCSYEKIYDYNEIGREFGLSGSHIGQIAETTIRKIRAYKKTKKLRSFLGQ